MERKLLANRLQRLLRNLTSEVVTKFLRFMEWKLLANRLQRLTTFSKLLSHRFGAATDQPAAIDACGGDPYFIPRCQRSIVFVRF